MKVKRIKVKNFKSFFDDEFEFDSKINTNYIYGANGIGKSTLLNVFNFLGEIIKKELNIFNYNMIPANFRNNEIANSINNIYDRYISLGSEDSIFFEIDFFDQNKENDIYRYSLEIISGDIVVFEKYSLIKNNKEEIFFEKRIKKEINISGISIEAQQYVKDLNKNTANLILSILFRKVSKDELNFKKESIFDVDSNIKKIFGLVLLDGLIFPPQIEDMVHFGKTFVPKIPKILSEKHENYELPKIINKWKEFIKGFETFVMSIDRNIVGIKLRIDDKKDPYNVILWYEFEKLIGDKIVSVSWEKESTGTKKYLGYYFSILGIKKQKDSIIYLDEFGNGLHEELIIKLSNYINEESIKHNKQVFIITHSAILLSDKFIEKKVSKNWNKERIIMDRLPSGKVVLDNLEGKNSRENNHIKFLKSLYGGGPRITKILTEYD